MSRCINQCSNCDVWTRFNLADKKISRWIRVDECVLLSCWMMYRVFESELSPWAYRAQYNIFFPWVLWFWIVLMTSPSSLYGINASLSQGWRGALIKKETDSWVVTNRLYSIAMKSDISLDWRNFVILETFRHKTLYNTHIFHIHISKGCRKQWHHVPNPS